MPGYIYGVLLALLQTAAVGAALYFIITRMQKDEEGKFKTGLKNFIQQLKAANKAVLIIPAMLLLALFAVDGFVASKVVEQKDAQQVMDFLLLDKMHRNSGDLLNDLSQEIKNFTDNHPEFNVKYKVERQSKPSYEDMVVDQAFQLVLYAEQKDLAQDPELKKITSILDNIEELKAEMARIEGSLSNPMKVQRGDTHLSLCQRYLKEEAKLDDKQIKSILKRTALFGSLVPNFYVYNLYKDGVFLTTVTQGEAKLTPMTVQKLSQRRIIGNVLKENSELKVSLDSLRNVLKIGEESVSN